MPEKPGTKKPPPSIRLLRALCDQASEHQILGERKRGTKIIVNRRQGKIVLSEVRNQEHNLTGIYAFKLVKESDKKSHAVDRNIPI